MHYNLKIKNMKIIIELDNLKMCEESKNIIANFQNVPIMMITPKSAIVDEIYFITNKVFSKGEYYV